MASRDLKDLQQDVADKARRLLDLAKVEGLDLLIYCTRRSPEEQARLYRQGRPYRLIEQTANDLGETWGRPDLGGLLLRVGPQYGDRIVTHAAPGQSLHNYGLAFDAVPLRDGRPVWGTSTDADAALWQGYGELVEEAGLEWAGRWIRFREFPHAQQPGMRWQELLREA